MIVIIKMKKCSAGQNQLTLDIVPNFEHLT